MRTAKQEQEGFKLFRRGLVFLLRIILGRSPGILGFFTRFEDWILSSCLGSVAFTTGVKPPKGQDYGRFHFSIHSRS